MVLEVMLLGVLKRVWGEDTWDILGWGREMMSA